MKEGGRWQQEGNRAQGNSISRHGQDNIINANVNTRSAKRERERERARLRESARSTGSKRASFFLCCRAVEMAIGEGL